MNLSPRASRWLNLLGTIALVALVVPFFAYAAPTAVGAEDSYVVLSGSMEPALTPGDVIFVYTVSPDQVTAGDVITYQKNEGSVPVTHRVTEVERTDDGTQVYHTKGDANEDPDQGVVSHDDLVGEVPTVTLPVLGTFLVAVPYVGYVVAAVNNTPYGVPLLVGVPLILLLLTELRAVFFRSDEEDSGEHDPIDAESADPVATDSTVSGDSATVTDSTVAGDSATTTDSTVAVDSATAGDPATGDDSTSEADQATIRVTDTDLTATTVILVALSVYAVIVGLLEQSTTAIVVAFAALVGTGAIGLFRITATPAGSSADPDEESDVGPDGTPDRVVDGSLPADYPKRKRVTIGALSTLVDLARDEDAWVLEDDDAYRLATDGVVYVTPKTDDGDDGDDIGEFEFDTVVDTPTGPIGTDGGDGPVGTDGSDGPVELQAADDQGGDEE